MTTPYLSAGSRVEYERLVRELVRRMDALEARVKHLETRDNTVLGFPVVESPYIPPNRGIMDILGYEPYKGAGLGVLSRGLPLGGVAVNWGTPEGLEDPTDFP